VVYLVWGGVLERALLIKLSVTTYFAALAEEVFMVSDSSNYASGTLSGVSDRGFVDVRERHEEGNIVGAAHSHVAWGAIIAGGLSALALLGLATSFGYACGIPGYRGGGFNVGTGFFAVITSMLAFFAGGLLATYLTPRVEMRTGIVHGMLAWVLGVMLMVVLSGAAIGAFRGAVMPDFRFAAVNGGYSHGEIVGAAWTVFLALCLSLITAIIGGIAGAMGSVRGGVRR
jgi:hypothetical protein